MTDLRRQRTHLYGDTHNGGKATGDPPGSDARGGEAEDLPSLSAAERCEANAGRPVDGGAGLSLLLMGTLMTDREIRELALQAVDGRVVGTWNTPPELWKVIFVPLLFADAATQQRWKQAKVAHVYGILGTDVTTSRAINGYPMFMEMRVLTAPEFLKLRIASNMAAKARARFLG